MQTESWLTYGDLDTALQQVGYVRHEFPDERIYRHAARPNAILTFPPLPWNEPIRTYHYVTTRKIVNDFDVADADSFELLLVRITHKQRETATAFS